MTEESPPAQERRAKMITVLKRTRLVLLLAVVCLTPLIVAPSFTLDQHNLPKLAFLMVIVSTVGALRCIELAMGGTRFDTQGLWIPATLAATPLVIAWIMSPYRGWALWGEFTRLQGLLPYLVVIALSLLLADAFRHDPSPIAWGLAISGGAAGAVAAYQMLFAGYDIGSTSTSGYVTSTLGHSNFAGGFFAIALPVAVCLWLRGGRGKWVALVSSALIADGLLFTFSQGAWIASFAGLSGAVGIYLSSSRARLASVGIATAGGLAAVAIGLVVVATTFDGLVMTYPFLESARIRGLLWVQALDVFAERPATGWGPNAFALEAPSHRVQEEAIAGGVFMADDPHSVPLSMAANAGVLGVAGLMGIVWWGTLLWRTRWWQRPAADSAIAGAFFGGAIGYGVQALVSLDEIALRVGLWACVAGMACASTRPRPEKDARTPVGSRSVAILVGAGCCGVAVWSAISLVPADHFALQGAKTLQRGEVAPAEEKFAAALRLREAMEYRRAYAESLGEAALEAERAGQPLIQEMDRQYKALVRQGDPHARRNHARYLHAWSLYQPSAEKRALRLFRAAARTDPYNPVLAAQLSDVLVNLGKPDQATEVLRPLVPLLADKYPRYMLRRSNEPFWGAVALAEAAAGNPEKAREAIRISEAAPGDECRTWIAREFLKPPAQRSRPQGIGFVCPSILLELLPEDP